MSGAEICAEIRNKIIEITKHVIWDIVLYAEIEASMCWGPLKLLVNANYFNGLGGF